jgi:hypothetical protein
MRMNLDYLRCLGDPVVEASTEGGAMEHLHWSSIAWGAVAGSLTLAIRLLIQEPVKGLVEKAFIVRHLWFLYPQRTFAGDWEVVWRVDSSRYRETNSDVVQIRRLFSNIAFQTRTTLLDGAEAQCVFIGKLVDRTITGRWYNPEDTDRCYFGAFQVRLSGNLRDGQGSWIGWTNQGTVQSEMLSLTKAA